MTPTLDLVQRLRERAGSWGALCAEGEAANLIEQQAAQIAALTADAQRQIVACSQALTELSAAAARESELRRELEQRTRERDEALDALRQIEQWADAYPLEVFPEPDWPKVREALAAAGITLDSVSASNMRHVVTGVGKIARAAAQRQEG